MVDLTLADYREILISITDAVCKSDNPRVQEYWLNMQSVVGGQMRRYEQASLVAKVEEVFSVTACDDEHATNHGADEYRCTKCGVIWGRDESRPPCYNFRRI